jgi:hypothetical protein
VTRSFDLTHVALTACAILLALLYIAAVNAYWSISPDSVTYVGFAATFAAGHVGEVAPPLPPMTSVVYAPLLALFPGSYLALNALTRVLLFVALAFFYALVARRSGARRALLVVVLTLASVSFWQASTQLLSEPAYKMFSAAALLLIERASGTDSTHRLAPRPPRRLRAEICAAGILMILATMTRTVGVALPLAVLVVMAVAKSSLPLDRSRRTVLAAFALLAILAPMAWDALVLHGAYAGNYLAWLVTAQARMHPDAPPEPSALERIVTSIALLPSVGSVLVNARAPSISSHLVLRMLATMLWALGLGLALRRRIGLTEVYVGIFAAVATLHALSCGTTDQNRFFVPVIPLLFAFALEAVDQMQRPFGRLATNGPMLLRSALAIYVAGYVILGLRVAIPGVREAHSSPLGSYPIKRPGNYDIVRAALWLKDNTARDERYASTQSSMTDVISERPVVDVVRRRTTSPHAFIAWLDEERVRYLIVDLTIELVRDPMLAAIAANPSRFRPVVELPLATVYELTKNVGREDSKG